MSAFTKKWYSLRKSIRRLLKRMWIYNVSILIVALVHANAFTAGARAIIHKPEFTDLHPRMLSLLHFIYAGPSIAILVGTIGLSLTFSIMLTNALYYWIKSNDRTPR